jgi:two-component system, NarL family, nitrate/nitrite response regulator NarL
MISVALIDDNRLVREGICALLNRQSDIRAVAGDPGGDLSLLKAANPQVILLDLGLQSADSLKIAEDVNELFPDARVVVMDLLPVHEDIAEFVRVGVCGFIMKDATLDELVSTVRSVVAGEKVLPQQMIGTLFSQIARDAIASQGEEAFEAVRMTPREQEVINLIAQGLSNKAIAAELDIATHTVKSHVRNVMEKLALHTRLQIAAYFHATAENRSRQPTE